MAKNDNRRGAGRSVLTPKRRSRVLDTPRDPSALNGPVITLPRGPRRKKKVAPARDERRYASKGQRAATLRRDRYRCRYCGKKVTNETANIDHVIPWRLGGRTKLPNLVTACKPCNKKKGNSQDRQWIPKSIC